MEISTELDVLGIIFTNDGKSEKHVNKRIQKCRQAFYSMSSSGMSYLGLPTDIKSHLWKTVCCPTLLYGMAIRCWRCATLVPRATLRGVVELHVASGHSPHIDVP